MKPSRTSFRLVRTVLKALLCARPRAEAASKQPLSVSGFRDLRAGKQPKGDKLKNPNFLAPFSYRICKKEINLLCFSSLRKPIWVSFSLFNLASKLGLLGWPVSNFQ
ncbi:hypothetical protein V8G54_006427 [Vigna mungo]|uniref:Uncharacterized protein n=1 Tax=Vigna mungo TaxID=3915 RepID=A0AAQ3P1A2_VIGMU